MKRSILISCLMSMLATVQAETLRYGDTALALRDQAKACYLRVIKLYDASYFRSSRGDIRCVKLDYLRSFDAQELAEATEKIFTRLHGRSEASRYRSQLDTVAASYQPVTPNDSYQFCVTTAGGELRRDGMAVAMFDDPVFGARFMNIWIKAESTASTEWNFTPCFGPA